MTIISPPAKTRIWPLVYLRHDIRIMALFGFASGLPLLLLISILSLRLRIHGIDAGTIGLFSLTGLPYVFRVLWAPLLDALVLPTLTARLGRRRASLLVVQMLLIFCIVVMGLFEPTSVFIMAILAFLIAFLSASQDVLIDAFRIENIPKEQQASALAVFTTFYRVAMATAFTGSVLFVEFAYHHLLLKTVDLHARTYLAWLLAHVLLGLFLGLGVLATCLAREKTIHAFPHTEKDPFGVRLKRATLLPLKAFVARSGWFYIILFILFYRVSDIFSGNLLIPFLLEAGYTSRDYAILASSIGLVMGFLGSFTGDFLTRFFGLYVAIFVAIFIQNSIHITFFFLDIFPVSQVLLALAVGMEGFMGAMGLVILSTWMSRLCQHMEFTGTEYALFMAIAAVDRIALPAAAGPFIGKMGYGPFFLLMILPTIPCFLSFLRIRAKF